MFVNCFLLFLLIVCVTGQQFGFPESVEDNTNRDNRSALYIPGRCQENELLYPGDQKDDWVCDCGAGNIYYPQTDKCYPIFRRGPCGAGQHLILPKGEVIPKCITNPCKEGSVLYMGQCHVLGMVGPCALPELGRVLGIKVLTLEVGCVGRPVELANRFAADESLLVGEGACKGSRRCYNGKCVWY